MKGVFEMPVASDVSNILRGFLLLIISMPYRLSQISEFIHVWLIPIMADKRASSLISLP
jgi:hypothetical protein